MAYKQPLSWTTGQGQINQNGSWRDLLVTNECYYALSSLILAKLVLEISNSHTFISRKRVQTNYYYTSEKLSNQM